MPRAFSRSHTAPTKVLLPLPGTPATPTSQGCLQRQQGLARGCQDMSVCAAAAGGCTAPLTSTSCSFAWQHRCCACAVLACVCRHTTAPAAAAGVSLLQLLQHSVCQQVVHVWHAGRPASPAAACRRHRRLHGRRLGGEVGWPPFFCAGQLRWTDSQANQQLTPALLLTAPLLVRQHKCAPR